MVQSFTAGQRLTAAELNAIAASQWSLITYNSNFAEASGGVASEVRFINSNTVLLCVRVSPTAALTAGAYTIGTVPSSFYPPNTVSAPYAIYNQTVSGIAQVTSAGVIQITNAPALATSNIIAINMCYGTDM